MNFEGNIDCFDVVLMKWLILESFSSKYFYKWEHSHSWSRCQWNGPLPIADKWFHSLKVPWPAACKDNAARRASKKRKKTNHCFFSVFFLYFEICLLFIFLYFCLFFFYISRFFVFFDFSRLFFFFFYISGCKFWQFVPRKSIKSHWIGPMLVACTRTLASMLLHQGILPDMKPCTIKPW